MALKRGINTMLPTLREIKEADLKGLIVQEYLCAPGTIRIPETKGARLLLSVGSGDKKMGNDLASAMGGEYIEPPLPNVLCPLLESDRFKRWLDYELRTLRWAITRDYQQHGIKRGSIGISTHYGHTKEEKRVNDGEAAQQLADAINANKGYSASCVLDYGRYWRVTYIIPQE